ncbi:hypothetical protein HDU81_004091 [Chytriomyces hyalinus]|nr:hypothetical protein HDU81_004091 [Chytriomyces hyalinus]
MGSLHGFTAHLYSLVLWLIYSIHDAVHFLPSSGVITVDVDTVKRDVETLAETSSKPFPSHISMIVPHLNLAHRIEPAAESSIASFIAFSILSGVKTVTVFSEHGTALPVRQSIVSALDPVLSRMHMRLVSATWEESDIVEVTVALPVSHADTVSDSESETSVASANDSGIGSASVSAAHSGADSDDSDSDHAHPFLTLANISLRFLDASQGKQKIVSAAKLLAKKALEHKNSNNAGGSSSRFSDSINLKSVEALCKPSAEMCDPDLLFVIERGQQPLTLHSYPPWELRLTEVCHIRGSHLPTYKHFLEGLAMYSKCERRIGK